MLCHTHLLCGFLLTLIPHSGGTVSSRWYFLLSLLPSSLHRSVLSLSARESCPDSLQFLSGFVVFNDWIKEELATHWIKEELATQSELTW